MGMNLSYDLQVEARGRLDALRHRRRGNVEAAGRGMGVRPEHADRQGDHAVRAAEQEYNAFVSLLDFRRQTAPHRVKAGVS